jgi:hypothetical protein
MFVDAFMGPTFRLGASGFFSIKVVCGLARVLPSKFFELRASSAFSSYQLDCLVASLLASITAARLAAYCVVPSMAVFVFWSAVEAFSALPLVLRRFTTRPSSPSASEPDEKSESDCGGGGATFRGAALAPRFLNLTTGASMMLL